MGKHKIAVEGTIPVTFLKEGRMFVAYSPVLDLSTCGKTFDEAKKNFKEVLGIFFKECIKHNTLESALLSCGWQKKTGLHLHHWQPPIVVGEDHIPIGLCT